MNARSPSESGQKKYVPVHLTPVLETLENAFNFQKEFSSKIFHLFSAQSNVFYYALDLMFYSKDFPKGRSCSFSQAVIESLKQWCDCNNLYHLLTLDLKYLAIERALQQPNGSFVKLICETFRVKEDYEYFKYVIKNALKEHKFKEAFYLIEALDAENDFTLEEFVFPVFFLDKEPWVKRFLEKRPDLHLKFIQTLDSICRSGNEILEFVRSLPYENLPVRRHVYDPSRLQKVLANYIDHFNVDIKECRNLYQQRCGSAMSYLVRKRYSEESIGQEAFEEMIKCILADNVSLQKAFLIKLVCFNDCGTAIKLAKDFNLHESDWPDILKTSVSNQETQVSRVPKHDCITYLKLRLDKSDVIFIDTPEKFLEAVDDISENYDVVGIDAEWRPNLGLIKENLSIYQLAVWDTVYIFDVLALKKYPDQRFWQSFVENIFCNTNILKLGYGLKNDVQLLTSMCFAKGKEVPKFHRILDFCEFFKKVRTCYPAVIDNIEAEPDPSTHDYIPTKGLSQLCFTLLGKPLNKDEQFSDWEHRPLRENQILYAALDAFCLLMMYEKLYHVLQDLHLDLEEVIKTTNMPTKNETPKKDKKALKELRKKNAIDHKATPISQFKVVVDNMIHGVGKYLRICGADVVFIGNEDDHMQTVEISQRENRVILTAGAPYLRIRGYVPDEMIFCVPTVEHARDQAAIILKHFNVQCTESDIFSRCSICSGNIYKKVSNEELFSLWSSIADTDGKMKEPNKIRKSIPAAGTFLSENGVLESGVPIQMSILSPKVFESVKYFFICTKCGKIYWEGSHFSRVKKHISKIIEVEENTQGNIYQYSGPAAETAAQILTVIENDSRQIDPVQVSPEITTSKKNFLSFDPHSSDDDDDIDDIVISCG